MSLIGRNHAEKPEIVFFDAAGTLIRLARPVGETYAAVGEHYGMKASGEIVERRFRQAWRELNGNQEQERFSKEWWKEVVRRSLPVEAWWETFPFDDYFEEVFAVYARADQWRVYPEVERVLDRLEQAGVRRAVLSNWDGRLRGILDGLGLADRFEWIGVSADLGAAKPDLAIFRRAEEAVRVSGSQVWLVGDDVEVDVAGANGAGWRGELVLRPGCNLEDALAGLWPKLDP